jgi:hypothetical protein
MEKEIFKTGIYSVIVVTKIDNKGIGKNPLEVVVDDIEYIELRSDLNRTESGIIYAKKELTIDELEKIILQMQG